MKIILLISCIVLSSVTFGVDIFNEPFYVRIEIPAKDMRDEDKQESYEWMLKYIQKEIAIHFPRMNEMSPVEIDKISRSKRFKDTIADYNFAFQEYNLGTFKVKDIIPNSILFPLIGGKINIDDIWGLKRLKKIPGFDKISTLAGILGVAWMRKLIIRINKNTHQVKRWYELEPAIIFQPYGQLGSGTKIGKAKALAAHRYGFGLVWGKIDRPSDISSITIGASVNVPFFNRSLNVKLGAMLSGTDTLRYFRAYMDPRVDLKDIIDGERQEYVTGHPAYDRMVSSDPLKGMYSMFLFEPNFHQKKKTAFRSLNIGGLIHMNTNAIVSLFKGASTSSVEESGPVTVQDVIQPVKGEVDDGCDDYEDYEINEMDSVQVLLNP